LCSACRQTRSALHAAAVRQTHTGRVNWTGLGTGMPVGPRGLAGSTSWHTSYKVARTRQGITANSSLTYSITNCSTAIAELKTGSNTPPTNSTKLLVTMQHKSSTALRCDSRNKSMGVTRQLAVPLSSREQVVLDVHIMRGDN